MAFFSYDNDIVINVNISLSHTKDAANANLKQHDSGQSKAHWLLWPLYTINYNLL